MGDQPPDLDTDRVRAFLAEVTQNPASFLATFDTLRAQVESNSSFNTPPSSTSPPQPLYDSQAMAMMAQVLAAAMRENTPVPRSRTPPRSEKLPDIPEYDGDMDKLDAWEQALVQRMDSNHDRYPTDRAKIAYAESRLTIGKKAHNLMNPYRRDGLCTITSFHDWRIKLREACGNPFEQEDARHYIRELKQGSMPFDEYYNLISQKKERSCMEDASLIDAMKHNVNYLTQQAGVAWRKADGQRPSTFAEYVSMYSEIDMELRQIKHRLPKTSQTSPNPSQSASRRPLIVAPVPVARANVTSAPVRAVTPVVPLSSGEAMDLSAAQAAVKGRKLSEPNVKTICDKWRLCYYCKLSHPGLVAKNCPNRTTQLRSGSVTELEDDQSVAGGVPLDAGKV